MPPGAKTKHEVTAALCQAASDAGLWPVPEFELAGADGNTRRIDVVWAERTVSSSGQLWTPIAAFEIEGHGVANALPSLRKDAESLTEAGRAGARVLALVLFQVGPDGTLWRPKGTVERTREVLRRELEGRSSPFSIEIETILDEELDGFLSRSIQLLHQE